MGVGWNEWQLCVESVRGCWLCVHVARGYIKLQLKHIVARCVPLAVADGAAP